VRRRTSLLVGALLLGAVLIGSATAQDGSTEATTIAETQDRTAAVAELAALSQQQPLHVGTGLAIGAGIGLVTGSLAMYGYWSRKL